MESTNQNTGEESFYYSKFKIGVMLFLLPIPLVIGGILDYYVCIIFKSIFAHLFSAGSISNTPLALESSLFLLVTAVIVTCVPLYVFPSLYVRFKDTDPQMIISSQGLLSKQCGFFDWNDISTLSLLTVQRGRWSARVLRFSASNKTYDINLSDLRDFGSIKGVLARFAPQFFETNPPQFKDGF
jgi:hypothetical protein